MLGKLTMGGTIVFIYEWYGQKKKKVIKSAWWIKLSIVFVITRLREII